MNRACSHYFCRFDNQGAIEGTEEENIEFLEAG